MTTSPFAVRYISRKGRTAGQVLLEPYPTAEEARNAAAMMRAGGHDAEQVTLPSEGEADPIKRFYWKRDPTHRGAWWSLFDKPPGESGRFPIGNCSRHADFERDPTGRKTFWRAALYQGADAPFAQAGSSVAAMRRLEAALDRRSISLFGVDQVAFERERQ